MSHWLLRNILTARIGDENEPDREWKWWVWFMTWTLVPAALITGLVLAVTRPFA